MDKPKTHFTRILDREQVNACIKMLNAIPEGKQSPLLKKGDDTFKITAPDGDDVLSAMRITGGVYITRLHKEVFDEGTHA